jgi:hypothetical protein
MGAVALTSIKQLGQATWNMSNRLISAIATFSSSYATGGDTLPVLTSLGMRQVLGLYVVSSTLPITIGGAYTPALSALGSYEVRLGGTATAPTLILRKGGLTPVEETNATNVSTFVVPILLEGRV